MTQHLSGGEGVGEIVLKKVRSFSPAVQRVLALASCVGVEFSAGMVARALRLMAEEEEEGRLRVRGRWMRATSVAF